jgi:hypothetical protein
MPRIREADPALASKNALAAATADAFRDLRA